MARLVVPLLFVAGWVVYFIDRRYYGDISEEDQLVNWLTVVGLAIAAILAARIALRFRGRPEHRPRFFAAFALACAFFAMEEMDWGQRVIGVKTPRVIRRHNTQGEINLHNSIRHFLDIKTKHVAGVVLFAWGVWLPRRRKDHALRAWLERRGVVFPDRAQLLDFALPVVLMIDEPTGREEEYGELLFSLAFIRFIGRRDPGQEADGDPG